MEGGVERGGGRLIRKKRGAPIRILIFEEVLFTIDNSFSLRDLVLQELVKILVVFYMKEW
jgi:hypothetical protein